jgi:chorismate dehydratase
MVVRVGQVPEISFEPFYNDMERRGLQLIQTPQDAMASALEQGEIDAGPVPLVDSFRLVEGYRPVAGFCLAVAERAGSDLLFSKEPIENLNGARIAVDRQDSTSAHLLRVLLNIKRNLTPEAFVAPQDSHDAMMITGHQALRRRRGLRGYPHKYDLGQEWYDWTGLPFVFARWLVRRDMDANEAALLEDTLYVGMEEGVDILFRESEPRDYLLMLARDIVEYILGFRYYIGLSEQKAIDLFHTHLQQLGAVEA